MYFSISQKIRNVLVDVRKISNLKKSDLLSLIDYCQYTLNHN
jgi:hypothetical protein